MLTERAALMIWDASTPWSNIDACVRLGIGVECVEGAPDEGIGAGGIGGTIAGGFGKRRPWEAAELGAFLDFSTADRLGPLFEVIAATTTVARALEL